MINFIPPFSVLNESSGKMSLSSLIIRFLEENQVLAEDTDMENQSTKVWAQWSSVHVNTVQINI